jgi:hypothetical protein
MKPRMNWEGDVKRWTKTHRKRKYAVTVKQLSEWCGRRLEPTKEGSYRAANEWYDAQIMEAESGGIVTPEMVEAKRRLDWCRANGDDEGAVHWAGVLAWLPRRPDLWRQAKRGQAIRTLLSGGIPWHVAAEMEMDDKFLDRVSGEQVWAERLQPQDEGAYTVAKALADFTSVRAAQVRSGGIAEGTHLGTLQALRFFVDFIGETTPVDKVDEDSWERYVVHLINRGDVGPGYQRRIQGAAKHFLKWLAGKKRIVLPANLGDFMLRIAEPEARVVVLPAATCRRIVEAVPDHVKACVLLGMNCLYTQQDFSDLRHDEVDWTEGRIRRKRSKTRKKAKVPTVDYKLWPETLDWLKRMRSDDPDRVLLTSTGLPWISGRIDRYRVAWRDHIQAKLDIEASPKSLRKTSANLINRHPEFGRYAQYALGQAPKTIAETHYVEPPDQETFDRVIDWLRGQYFPVD